LVLIASQALPRWRKLGSRRVENCQKCLILLARSEGFEPPTPRFEVWCSIQLSYERRRLLYRTGDLNST
jgi:hypothetical protein